jgi:hypothetical protein
MGPPLKELSNDLIELIGMFLLRMEYNRSVVFKSTPD